MLVHETCNPTIKRHRTSGLLEYERIAVVFGYLEVRPDAYKVSQVFKSKCFGTKTLRTSDLSTGEVEISLKGFEISTFKIVV